MNSTPALDLFHTWCKAAWRDGQQDPDTLHVSQDSLFFQQLERELGYLTQSHHGISPELDAWLDALPHLTCLTNVATGFQVKIATGPHDPDLVGLSQKGRVVALYLLDRDWPRSLPEGLPPRNLVDALWGMTTVNSDREIHPA
jgi:hypothetical protein